ncbi:MAG: hypothetical protein HFE04_02310 [Bacilli bacterium]|nr:hypothetical protein [Bacilli bacterium]
MEKKLKSIDLHLIANLILSIIVLIMGIVIMIFKAFGLTDIILYVSVLFYIFAFFGIIAYFVKRKEGDYELLLLSLINIMVATYMFVFQKDNLPMILGSAMTVYTILVVTNRGYKVLMLKNQDNFMWIIKFIMTFLLAFVGILTTINLFNETTVQTMMMGYYFITTGILMTIESSIELFVTDRAFNKIMSKLVDEENKNLEEINEIKEEPVITASVEKKPKKKTTIKVENKTKTKKSETKVEESKPKTQTKSKTSKTAKSKKEATETKKTQEPKKAGRPKKEAAVKESKKSEIKIVEKKSPATKTKKEPTVATKNKAVKKVETKTVAKKTTKAETTKKKPGRPKKISSK